MGWRRRDVCNPPSKRIMFKVFYKGRMWTLSELYKFYNLCTIFIFYISGFQNKKCYLCQIHKCSPWDRRWFTYVVPPPTRFGHPMAKNSDLILSTGVWPDGSNSKILTWREYFALELYPNSAYCFFPEFFTWFGHTMAENSFWYFRRRCDQMGQIQKCWPGDSIFASELYTSGV